MEGEALEEVTGEDGTTGRFKNWTQAIRVPSSPPLSLKCIFCSVPALGSFLGGSFESNVVLRPSGWCV